MRPVTNSRPVGATSTSATTTPVQRPLAPASQLQTPVSSFESTSLPPPRTAVRPNPYAVSLTDALRFNGPAPELINGRLAMVGFVNGALHEIQYNETFLQQAQDLDIFTVLILLGWVYASLVPILKGVRNNEAFGPFSPTAEIVNGRVAMLAIVALTALEQTVGVPFF